MGKQDRLSAWVQKQDNGALGESAGEGSPAPFGETREEESRKPAVVVETAVLAEDRLDSRLNEEVGSAGANAEQEKEDGLGEGKAAIPAFRAGSCGLQRRNGFGGEADAEALVRGEGGYASTTRFRGVRSRRGSKPGVSF